MMTWIGKEMTNKPNASINRLLRMPLESRENDYRDARMEESFLRIESLRLRIDEISEGKLGKEAREYMDGVVFSEDEIRLMPASCFYNTHDVLHAIELEEDFIEKCGRMVQLNIDSMCDDIIPGQISIWDLDDVVQSEYNELLLAA